MGLDLNSQYGVTVRCKMVSMVTFSNLKKFFTLTSSDTFKAYKKNYVVRVTLMKKLG